MSTCVRFVIVTLALLLATAPRAEAAIADATLEVSLGQFPPAIFAGTGVGSSAGLGGAATLNAGVLSGNVFFPVTPPLSGLIDGFAIGAPGVAPGGMVTLPAQNSALSFDGTLGTMGLNASAYLLMAGGVLAEIPLGVVGVGGTQMFHVLTLVAGTANANPFQLGMVTLMGALNGATHTVSGTGVDSRTASGNGTLVLVSPTMINLGALGSLASVAKLTIDYVPEPGALLLLGGGFVAIAGIGRRRRVS